MATCSDTRTGFAFNNPDTTSSYLAPGWGMLMTADELRYDELFGNPLIAEADSQAITDEQLSDYIRVAIAYVEGRLKIDILPRRIRYDDPIGQSGTVETRTDFDDGDFTSRMNQKQLSQLYIREPGYAYRVVPSRYECRIKLRRRPVRDLLTAKMVDPYYGNIIYDLMPYRVMKRGLTGVCYFRPRQLTYQVNTYSTLWQYIFQPYNVTRQNVFLIDYESGYENCVDVPDELRYVIRKLAAVTLMNIYGDGKFAAIASRSVNLNSVSESISTTMSATSAAFGARIIQYQKEIKEWFALNSARYARTMIGVL